MVTGRKGIGWLSERSAVLSWIMWENPTGAVPSSPFPEIGSTLGGWLSVCNTHRLVRENESLENAGRTET